MATVTLKGSPIQVGGEMPKPGATAPDFRLVDKDLQDTSLQAFAGKKKILNIFPSVDTPVCAESVRAFNRHAEKLKDAVVLCIAADLPFAFGRFCGAEKIANVITLSTMRGRNFAKDYGVLIESGKLAGLCARACFVLDRDNKVLHAELVKEIAQEPDYDAALKALA